MKKKIFLRIGFVAILCVISFVFFKTDIHAYMAKGALTKYCKTQSEMTEAECNHNLSTNFDRCILPVLGQRSDGAELLVCLGIMSRSRVHAAKALSPIASYNENGAVETKSVVVASCDSNNVAFRLTIKAAQLEPRSDYDMQIFQGKTFYLAKNPGVDSKDIQSIELTEENGKSFINILLTYSGKESFAKLTEANIQRYVAILRNNQIEAVPQVMAKINGDKVLFALTNQPKTGDICNP